jgi:hypothetical protein
MRKHIESQHKYNKTTTKLKKHTKTVVAVDSGAPEGSREVGGNWHV